MVHSSPDLGVKKKAESLLKQSKEKAALRAREREREKDTQTSRKRSNSAPPRFASPTFSPKGPKADARSSSLSGVSPNSKESLVDSSEKRSASPSIPFLSESAMIRDLNALTFSPSLPTLSSPHEIEKLKKPPTSDVTKQVILDEVHRG